MSKRIIVALMTVLFLFAVLLFYQLPRIEKQYKITKIKAYCLGRMLCYLDNKPEFYDCIKLSFEVEYVESNELSIFDNMEPGLSGPANRLEYLQLYRVSKYGREAINNKLTFVTYCSSHGCSSTEHIHNDIRNFIAHFNNRDECVRGIGLEQDGIHFFLRSSEQDLCDSLIVDYKLN